MSEIDFQIIANLMAGKGSAEKTLEKLKNFLKKNNQSYTVLAIERPTPISLLPKDEHQITKAVICIGGDGTISETVGYILNKNLKVPLAVIPTGTANIIASSFNLDQKKDFSFLVKNNLKKIDIGLAEYGEKKNYFLLGFGLGFEEKFLKVTKEKLKSRFGVFSYILSALAELLALKKLPVEIEFEDNKIKTNVCTLMILNMPAKILKIFPLFKDQSLKDDDGLLDLTYVEYKNFIQAVIGTLLMHVLGKNTFGTTKSFKAKEFSLKSDKLIGTQIDGELKQNLPVKLSLLPQSFNFLI